MGLRIALWLPPNLVPAEYDGFRQSINAKVRKPEPRFDNPTTTDTVPTDGRPV